MKAIEVSSKACSYVIALACPVMIVFFFFGKNIVGIWGAEFVRYVDVLYVLLIGQFVNVACGPAGKVLMYGEFGWLRNAICIGALGIDIALNYIFILKYGYLGAAIATSFSIACMQFCFWLAAGKVSHLYIVPKVKYIMQVLGIKG
ncbi:hypothetical protein GCM10027567_16410 [Spongiibacter taiwanensis]